MQVVTILCDWCHAESEREEAEGETTVSLDGKAMTADLCARHRKTMEEGLAMFFSIARRADRPPTTITPRSPAPSGPPRANRQRSAHTPNENGEYECLVENDGITCERVFTTPQGVGRHRLVVHGIPGVTTAGKRAREA